MTNLNEKKAELINLQRNNSSPTKKDLLIEIQNELNKLSLPHSKTEEWRNTNVNSILNHKYILGKKESVPLKYVNTFSFNEINADRLVLINGHFSDEYSHFNKTSGIQMGSIKKNQKSNSFKKYYGSTNLYKSNFFAAYNSAYAEDGIFIHIPENVIVEHPIHIVNFIYGNNQKTISQAHNLIIAEKNSHAKILTTYHSLSEDFTFNNVATEIICSENSDIEFYVFEGEGDTASIVNNTYVNQLNGSKFLSNTSTLCGSLVRNEIHIDLLGENCESDLQGIYFPDKEQHIDNYVSIKHSKPNCKSNQLYKGIIDNKAETVFTGKVFVAPDAQKTDAAQSNRNILLTDNSKAHSRPQLEIYADDVRCSHGSTTGQIDKEALFYMKTRGIPELKAKTLLMTAFIGDIIEHITVKPYRDYVNYLVNKKLKGQEPESLCHVKICPACEK